jgi:hypothetical protein
LLCRENRQSLKGKGKYFVEFSGCLRIIRALPEADMIKSIFHVNINVKDFDRSSFYRMLGFEQVVNAGNGHLPEYNEGFRIPNNHGRAALLR